MADENHTDLPPGVSRLGEWNDCESFEGEESALIAAGMVRPEWLSEWSGQNRQIAIGSNGDFRIIHEGKGNGMKDCYRDAGAVSVKRLKSGRIAFTKYRTTAEWLERKSISVEEHNRRITAQACDKPHQPTASHVAPGQGAPGAEFDPIERIIELARQMSRTGQLVLMGAAIQLAKEYPVRNARLIPFPANRSQGRLNS